MASIKRYKSIFDQTAAGTGAWIALDSRYDESPTRALDISVTTGDTITIQGTTKDVKGIDKSFLNTLPAQDITTLKSYTADDSDVLEGPWTYIRVVKTGSTGRGSVTGFI